MNGATLLSKWWQTESAQRAFARAAENRRARIDVVRERFNSKREALASEVENWQPIEPAQPTRRPRKRYPRRSISRARRKR